MRRRVRSERGIALPMVLGKCKFDDDIMISSPILCDKVAIKEDTDWSTIWPWPSSLISSIPGQVYSDPGGDFQIVLTNQYG